MSGTRKKVKTLIANDEDFEWYPTTDEILQKMNSDLHTLFTKGNLAGWGGVNRREKLFACSRNCNRETDKDEDTYTVHSFLDVGAGDGRVFDVVHGENNSIEVHRRYGIELARAQADDLINRDVFIIGRDFFKTSLLDKEYSVIFSNPPYSRFVEWTEKLFAEANFGVMYLVLPVRWKQSISERCGVELYDVKNIGEFDFMDAERKARARVNLIRVMHKQVKVEDTYRGEVTGHHVEYGKEDEPDSFERWCNENIGTFDAEPESVEEREERALKLRGMEIPELVQSFEDEAQALFGLFKSIGKTPYRVLAAFNINRKSILEIIREDIRGLKKRYWQIAFDKLSPIKTRLTHYTREQLLSGMQEFNSLDFNEDNIYTIVVWVIKHFNEYTNEQLLSVFDELTSQDYIKAYKSNVHWSKDDWYYAKDKGKPGKYQLDYRLVTHYYKSYRYAQSTVDDFIVICRSLGFEIPDYRYLEHDAYGEKQDFYTADGTLAFTVRVYMNHNAHMKINQNLMRKFNVEVAKLRHWVNGPKDIAEEFDVSVVEALKLWKTPHLKILGNGDVKLLGFDERKSA